VLPLQTSAQLLVEPVLHPFLRPQQLPNVVAAPFPRGETRSTRFHSTTTWFWGVDLSNSACKKYNGLNIAWEYRPTFLYRPNPKFIPSVAKCLAFSCVSFDSMSLASASVAWKDTKGSLHHKYEQNRCRSTLQKALQLVKNHFEVGSATNCYFLLLYMQSANFLRSTVYSWKVRNANASLKSMVSELRKSACAFRTTLRNAFEMFGLASLASCR